MALSIFADKASPPRDDDVAQAIGRSHAHWRAIVETGVVDQTPLAASWVHSGANWGWSLRLRHGKRNLVYLTPRSKHFLAGFALGEKAVRAAKASDLPEPVLEVIRDAKKYMEGRAVRLEVRNRSDRDAVLRVLMIKAQS